MIQGRPRVLFAAKQTPSIRSQWPCIRILCWFCCLSVLPKNVFIHIVHNLEAALPLSHFSRGHFSPLFRHKRWSCELMLFFFVFLGRRGLSTYRRAEGGGASFTAKLQQTHAHEGHLLQQVLAVWAEPNGSGAGRRRRVIFSVFCFPPSSGDVHSHLNNTLCKLILNRYIKLLN